MNIVPATETTVQQQVSYDYNKEILMKRLADASQYKIYPSVIPRNELPLRKILLTTRLWNHVRRQQALLTTIQSENWMFENNIPSHNNTNTVEEKKRSRSNEDNHNSSKKSKSITTIDYPDNPAGPVNNNNNSTATTTTTTTTNNNNVVLLSA